MPVVREQHTRQPGPYEHPVSPRRIWHSCSQCIDIHFDLSNHKDVLSFPAKYSLDTPWVDYTVYTVLQIGSWQKRSVCVLAGVRRCWDVGRELLPAPGFPARMPERMWHHGRRTVMVAGEMPAAGLVGEKGSC